MRLLLAAWAIAAYAQNGASVEGKVVDSATGRPIAGAVVLLQGKDDAYLAECDSAGRFRVEAIVPGPYQASAEHDGYIPLARGAAANASVYPRLMLQAGGREEIVLKLIPLGSISGRVTDLDGDPISKVSVEALGYIYADGKKELKSFERTNTDDRGEFRLHGLAPGRYYLKASRTWLAPSVTSSMKLLGPRVSSEFLPTFFPGSLDLAGAAPIDVSPSGAVKDRVILMAPAQKHTLRVTLLGPPNASSRPMVGVTEPGGRGMMMMMTGAYGSTRIYPDSVPGIYFVMAEDKTLGISAQQWVQVIDADVDVTLTLRPNVSLGGMMWAEGGARVPLERASVWLEAEGGSSRTVAVNADGTFTIHHMLPVMYNIQVRTPPGAYLKSIRMGEHELTSPRFDGSRPGGVIAITLGADGGCVDGIVVNPKGAAVVGAIVVAAPAGKLAAWTGLLRSATSGKDGRFEVRDLAPGEYRVYAFVDAEEGAPLDADFRRPFEARGVTVQVEASGQVTLRLPAIAVADGN